MVILLDFEKCFDKIEMCAILGAMKHYGFSEYLIKWTEIMYRNFSAVVQNNGNFSARFAVKKGVHQGGPASSLYFLMCAGLLATTLRQDTDIQGIPVEDIRSLLSQFADDMDIYSLFNQGSIQKVFTILENFKLQTGFTINYDKTQIYRIGSLRDSNAQFYSQWKINWTNDPILVSGIKISTRTSEINTINYEPLIQKIKGILSTWKMRQLSLIRKVQIINTLIASLFVYKMTVFPKNRK